MRTDVLFGILLTLLNKPNVTAQYLATKFEVSVRTVYRYLSILDSSNIPLLTKSGRGGGITLCNTIPLQKTFFTKEEILCLLNLSQTIENQQTKIAIQTKLLSIH